MNNIKLEIEQIERNIESSISKLITLKTNLKEKVSSITMNIVLTEMLALGFSAAYVLIPSKKGVTKRTRFIGAIILLKIRKIARVIVTKILGNQTVYK